MIDYNNAEDFRGNMEFRTASVDHSAYVTEQLNSMFEHAMDGKYNSDLLRVNAKALFNRLLDDLYDTGVGVGATYYPSELAAWRELQDYWD